MVLLLNLQLFFGKVKVIWCLSSFNVGGRPQVPQCIISGARGHLSRNAALHKLAGELSHIKDTKALGEI
jgi:hypothetical protein